MALHRDELTDELFRSILSLKDVDECYEYFEDLCTVKEIRDMGQRLCIARMLDRGSSYLQAADAVGASSSTVGRVKRCLDYGSGGYRKILDRLEGRDDEGI